MDDLISRAGAIKKLKSLLYETAFNSAEQHRDSTLYADIADNRIGIWLNLIPAVDAIPVVRCKDCEHSYFASNRIPDERCWSCEKHGIDVTPDWFCADGERRGNDGNSIYVSVL